MTIPTREERLESEFEEMRSYLCEAWGLEIFDYDKKEQPP